MIGWEDILKVVTAVTPLYVALVLGYGSVKWWHMFNPDHCDAINKFNCYFIMPLFGFEFVSRINPYKFNYLFLAADVISKCIVAIVLALWSTCSSKGSFSWSITTFSLSTLNNTLVVGVPLLGAMYGKIGADLVIQSSVIQAILWFTALLFMLEVRRALSESDIDSKTNNRSTADAQSSTSIEMGMGSTDMVEHNPDSGKISKPTSFGRIMKIVFLKLAVNPNFYCCTVGIIWALLANRWHFKMPDIIEGSILIMSKAGSGVAMFNMGLFMALQGKAMACGAKKTLFGMVLRFVVGPATTAIGSLAVGLRGNVLRVAIIQAALPQSVTSFVYAQEYGLHTDVLSTAVSFGTIASLPLLIAYYAMLGVI